MRVQLLILVAFTLLTAIVAQQEGGKRRRIKKKIVKNRIVPERRVLRIEEEVEEEMKAEEEVEEQVEAVEEYVGEVARQLFTAVEQEDVSDIAAENRPKQGRG